MYPSLIHTPASYTEPHWQSPAQIQIASINVIKLISNCALSSSTTQSKHTPHTHQLHTSVRHTMFTTLCTHTCLPPMQPHCGTRPPPAPTGCLIPRVSFVCSTTRRHACRLPGQHRTAGFVCNAVPVKQQGGSDTEEEGGKAGGGGGGKTRNSIQKRKNTKSKGDMKSKGENQAVKHGQRDEEPEEEVVSQQQAAQWDSLAASLVQRANEMAMESDIEGTSYVVMVVWGVGCGMWA